VEEGAETPVFLATLPDGCSAAMATGKYFADSHEAPF
jgi:hypothetical protein